MLSYRDLPGWYAKERLSMLNDSRTRQALILFSILLLMAALMGVGHYIPCPGGIGGEY